VGTAIGDQGAYWDSEGTTKVYGHPFDPTWFPHLDRHARVLDFGCGYGRVAGEMAAAGFVNVEGVDPSPQLIERARASYPGAQFTVLEDTPHLPHANETFDAVVLFAVLTCIPDESAQRAVITEIHRVLRPTGVLYVSDYCLQQDERNRLRYERDAERFGAYGIFETGDGAICRHHTREYLEGLLDGFTVSEIRKRPVATMNGNPAVATQMLAVKNGRDATGE
jgi:SAM-dependent methyltransferase